MRTLGAPTALALTLISFTACSSVELAERVLPPERCYAATVVDEDDGRVLAGIEDITIDHQAKAAYLSVFPRRQEKADKKNTRGGIYSFDLEALDWARNRPVRAKHLTEGLAAGLDFRPHGISLHRDGRGRRTLFAVSHPLREPRGVFEQEMLHVVEVFDLGRGDTLTHRETIKSEEDGGTAWGARLCAPNDVAALDHDRFLVTNMFASCSRLGQPLEGFVGLAGPGWANVLYYESGLFTPVADGLRYANGIAVVRDEDGAGTVFVAAAGDRALLEYDLAAMLRGPGVAEPLDETFVGSALDNIEVDPKTGTLYIGAHPSRMAFARHAFFPGTYPTAPSEVVRFPTVEGKAGPRISGVERYFYADDGAQLSASSVAAVDGDDMLVGSVFAGMAVCDLSGLR